ncbi:MAG: ATP-binding domain-containing protein, partial [Flavobacteriales bacterium]|nr:ATP-binding domain-containing protein [Flavobacteriales bacterium]
ILVSNNYNYPQMELLNGDFGIVKKVSPQQERRLIKLKRKNRINETVEINVSLTFRNLTIESTNEEFIKHEIECKVIENLLYSRHRDLSSDELKAIYIDFKIRNPKLKAGTKEFKDAIRSDAYFNALRIKFGYAVTCHKAQGGEWTNTFLNCKTSMGYFNSSYFRWLYTGITRAKENLFTIDEPHFTIKSNLQPPKVENITPREDILVLSEEVSDFEIPFDLSNEIPFVRHIYLAINEYLKDENISISHIRHTNYLEHYTFSRGTETAIFKISYNGQNKITTIHKPANTNEFIENTYTKLIQLRNKVIVITEQKTEKNEVEFEFDRDFLKEFYENVKEQLEPEKFIISKIEHNSWHEIYEIKRGGFIATYKFWYDGKGRFKKIEIIPTRTTGLVEEINKLLKSSVGL